MNTFTGKYTDGLIRYFITRKPPCDDCSKDCHRCNIAIGQIGEILPKIPKHIKHFEISGLYGQAVYRRMIVK